MSSLWISGPSNGGALSGEKETWKTNMDACNQNNYVHILLYDYLDYKEDNLHEKLYKNHHGNGKYKQLKFG